MTDPDYRSIGERHQDGLFTINVVGESLDAQFANEFTEAFEALRDWRNAVAQGDTTLGLEAWVEDSGQVLKEAEAYQDAYQRGVNDALDTLVRRIDDVRQTLRN